MISAFRMGPAASLTGLFDIDRVLICVAISVFKKIGKSLHDENIPITMEIEKLKLSVYFRHARSSQFSDN